MAKKQLETNGTIDLSFIKKLKEKLIIKNGVNKRIRDNKTGLF